MNTSLRLLCLLLLSLLIVSCVASSPAPPAPRALDPPTQPYYNGPLVDAALRAMGIDHTKFSTAHAPSFPSDGTGYIPSYSPAPSSLHTYCTSVDGITSCSTFWQ